MFIIPAPWDWLVKALACFLVSWIGCLIVIKRGPRDVPNERSSHSVPIARGGGLGIVLGFGLGMVFTSFDGLPFWEMHVLWWSFTGLCALMSLPGFWDDLWSLSATTRLVAQFFICAVFLGVGAKLTTLHLPLIGEITLGVFAIPLSLFWLVGAVNAFNFLDGLNGLTGGMSLLGAIFLGLIAWMNGDYVLLEICAFFACACLGFLILNFPKPSIFLGDGGAYFMGAFWGGMALVKGSEPGGHISFWTIPLIFFMPLCDVAITLVRRFVKGRPVFKPHREYHMLLLHRIGWSHTKVTCLYWGFVCVQGGLAIYMQSAAPSRQPLFFLPLMAFALWFFPWVLHRANRAGITL
ncbi:MAG: undecaprenyl/decaprenyl-phosphate alpha-N-acetylglucosaminyl 1-phosphate transferase [Proteobacteria bacterium]|nr:undecaprenyl/decaprenyl-phosphate alpha-N-acetylglucosaminyl 1-phosphate transferase [Pseudomonadota bacterium]